LVVKEDGTAKLIPNIAPMENTSGNWMGTVLGHPNLNHFFGRARNLGIFKIDYENNKITPVLATTSNTILSQALDFDGKNLFALTTDGN
jgi:hypothetical protein